MKNKLTQSYNDVDTLLNELEKHSPSNYINNMYNRLDVDYNKLNALIKYKISIEKEKLSKYKAIIVLHNPLNVLDKGYSIITDEYYNEVIRNINVLKTKDEVNIRLKDGKGKFKLVFMEDL